MMASGKHIQEYIMHIAQKARAVGIHLILTTQHFTTDVITGVIKANIPSRIAFTTTTEGDSRAILGECGAETLLGSGDMLYAEAGSPDLTRIHGAFVSDEEITAIDRFFCVYVENLNNIQKISSLKRYFRQLRLSLIPYLILCVNG